MPPHDLSNDVPLGPDARAWIVEDGQPATACEQREPWTAEEVAALRAIRAGLRAERLGEMGIDPRRAAFACWLLAHGWIGEGE